MPGDMPTPPELHSLPWSTRPHWDPPTVASGGSFSVAESFLDCGTPSVSVAVTSSIRFHGHYFRVPLRHALIPPKKNHPQNDISVHLTGASKQVPLPGSVSETGSVQHGSRGGLLQRPGPGAEQVRPHVGPGPRGPPGCSRPVGDAVPAPCGPAPRGQSGSRSESPFPLAVRSPRSHTLGERTHAVPTPYPSASKDARLAPTTQAGALGAGRGPGRQVGPRRTDVPCPVTRRPWHHRRSHRTRWTRGEGQAPHWGREGDGVPALTRLRGGTGSPRPGREPGNGPRVPRKGRARQSAWRGRDLRARRRAHGTLLRRVSPLADTESQRRGQCLCTLLGQTRGSGGGPGRGRRGLRSPRWWRQPLRALGPGRG